MKTIALLLSAALVAAALAAGAGPASSLAPATQPAAPATQASEAVRVNGLDFQVVTSAIWAKPAVGSPTRVPLALKVTNHTDKPVALNLFYTLMVSLKDAAGTEVPMRRLQRGVVGDFTPVTIKSGESALLDQTAALFPDPAPAPGEDAPMELAGRDGGGGFWFFADLKPGKYTVAITYENTEEPARWWTGKAVAGSLSVRITDQPAASQPADAQAADAQRGLPPMSLLTGKATDWRGQPVAGGNIEVYDQTPRMVGMGRTKSDGSFALLVEPKGDVDVTVDFAGGRWYRLHVPAKGPRVDLGDIQLSQPAPRPGRPVVPLVPNG